MYGGEPQRVRLEGKNDMVGPLIDRFGKDNITISRLDENHFSASVEVIPSSHFLGWIMSLGEGVRITGPEDVVEKMRNEARRLAEVYL